MSLITSGSRRSPVPVIPANAHDLVPHEADGLFLGWTYQIRSIFPWRTRWYCVHPDGTNDELPCSSLTDAVNRLRGPHGLLALYDENA